MFGDLAGAEGNRMTGGGTKDWKGRDGQIDNLTEEAKTAALSQSGSVTRHSLHNSVICCTSGGAYQAVWVSLRYEDTYEQNGARTQR